MEDLEVLFRFLISEYSYLGLFLVEAISSASIFIPVPGYLAVLLAGAKLNPFGVAVASGLGSTVGELTGYLLGMGGMKLIGDRSDYVRRHSSELEAARRIFSRYGPSAIFIFAATPLPFDLAGILCGTLGFDLKIFFLGTFAGKTMKFLLLAYAGRGLFEMTQSLLEGKINMHSLFLLVLMTVLMIGPLVYWKILVDKLRRGQPNETGTADTKEDASTTDDGEHLRSNGLEGRAQG